MGGAAWEQCLPMALGPRGQDRPPVPDPSGTGGRGGAWHPAFQNCLANLVEQLHAYTEQMGNVALMPLWWNVEPTLMLKGVKGPILVRNTATWNIFDWNKE